MHKDDVNFLIQLLHKLSGLVVGAEKAYWLESRLMPVARAHHCADVAALVALLRDNPEGALLAEVTEAMMSTESSFFRDVKPFGHLRKIILPQLHRNAGSRHNLRIWSAGCSTGQEPYSIAMTLLEDTSAHAGWKYEIVATDIARKAVEKARQGIYSQFEAQRGMPIMSLLNYFNYNPDTSWQAKDELRSMVQFSVQNMLEDFAALGPFDVIFCRHLLLYFDGPTKIKILERMRKIMQPGGFLFLGNTESVMDKNLGLVQPEGLYGIYQAAEKSPQYN